MGFDIGVLRVGLILSMLTLIFGISMGVMFGTNEGAVKQFISDGIATHPAQHDEKSQSKIWRYAQRSHFHATGVAGFALVLILLTGLTSLSRKLKFTHRNRQLLPDGLVEHVFAIATNGQGWCA